MINDNQLVNQLESLNIHFLANDYNHTTTLVAPQSLILNLVGHIQARFRLALIPLFLTRPDFAIHVEPILTQVDKPLQVTLSCYYTAAHLLQQKYRTQLQQQFGQQPELPDLFDAILHLKGETADQRLHQLAQQQAILSNRFINWYGTYEHAFQRLIKTQFIQSATQS